MAKKQSTSGWGVFGAFFIAIGVVAGIIAQSAYITIVCVCVGLLFMIIASVIERLDVIIGLLKKLTGDDKKT